MKSLKNLSLAIIFCTYSCGAQTDRTQDLESRIQGLWWYQETDGSYAEVLIYDGIFWFFDERFGIHFYNYKISDNVLSRYYPSSENLFGELILNNVDTNTMEVLSGNQKFNYNRLSLNGISAIKLIQQDEVEIEKYLSGFDQRKIAFLKDN